MIESLLSGLVKLSLTPIAVVKDAVNIATNQEPDATKKLLESATDDLLGEE